MGFCLKSQEAGRFGYAAGCAVVAPPRRKDFFYSLGLCPLSGLWPNTLKGQARAKGIAPGKIVAVVGAASRRRTSGGIAEQGCYFDFLKGRPMTS